MTIPRRFCLFATATEWFRSSLFCDLSRRLNGLLPKMPSMLFGKSDRVQYCTFKDVYLPRLGCVRASNWNLLLIGKMTCNSGHRPYCLSTKGGFAKLFVKRKIEPFCPAEVDGQWGCCLYQTKHTIKSLLGSLFFIPSLEIHVIYCRICAWVHTLLCFVIAARSLFVVRASPHWRED